MGSVRVISWHEDGEGEVRETSTHVATILPHATSLTHIPSQTSNRILELGVSGMGGGEMLSKAVDFKLSVSQLRDAHLAHISVEGSVSPVNFVIRYTDWLLIRSILKENVGDVPEISNLEREYEGLVEGARVVRYGGKKEANNAKRSPLKASLSLAAFTVKLVRNDDSTGDRHYEMTEVIMTEVRSVRGAKGEGWGERRRMNTVLKSLSLSRHF